ncbi:MAG TPA: histidinol-phosphatase [Chryseolinea sp.]
MWSNFHMHTPYCDGKSESRDYLEQAEKLNMPSIGFSSHAPVPFPTKWCMKAESLKDYLNEIQNLKKAGSSVEIYTGLEVDFIPGLVSPNLFRYQLDYTVGSIHFVEKIPDGPYWEIDGTHAIFLEGFSKIFNNNIKEATARYFELTREMISTACPTVIGHLDKIKIQNPGEKFFKETDNWYFNQVKETIDVIHASGAIVEVNTRGIYQKKSHTTYPSPWILEMVHAKNIPVTISSDAHHREDIINQFPETALLLKKIGFRTISVLSEGVWKPFAFDQHGIKP